jgi:hypothetical protein
LPKTQTVAKHLLTTLKTENSKFNKKQSQIMSTDECIRFYPRTDEDQMKSLIDGERPEFTASTQSSVTKAQNSSSCGVVWSSTAAAADLIKTLDSAFANMNQSAVSAAGGAEEARRNARIASEIARL